MQYTKFMAIALFAVASAAPCPSPPQECTPVLELAASDPNFSTFVAAFDASILTPSVTEGELTYFVPTNAAFAKLGDAVNDIVANPTEVTLVLLNHITGGSQKLEDNHDTKTFQSLSQNPLKVVGDSTVNNITISSANIPVCGGYVNVIDSVLVPPPCKSAFQLASENPELSTFVTAVTNSNISASEIFSTTVFVPTNDAFAALPEGTLDALLNDVNLMNLVLSNHIVKGLATTDGEDYTTLAAQTITFQNSTCASADSCRIQACDAVVNVINTVLVPEFPNRSECSNILEVASSNEDLSTFVAAFTASKLDPKILNGTTAFVPTNEAFANLPNGTLDALLKPENIDVLQTVLANHLFRGQYINNVTDDVSYPFVSFQGKALIVGENSVDGGTVTNATLVAKNIKTCDNVVNVIDKVLVPAL